MFYGTQNIKISPAGIWTRVLRVKAEYPNQLDYRRRQLCISESYFGTSSKLEYHSCGLMSRGGASNTIIYYLCAITSPTHRSTVLRAHLICCYWYHRLTWEQELSGSIFRYCTKLFTVGLTTWTSWHSELVSGCLVFLESLASPEPIAEDTWSKHS